MVEKVQMGWNMDEQGQRGCIRSNGVKVDKWGQTEPTGAIQVKMGQTGPICAKFGQIGKIIPTWPNRFKGTKSVQALSVIPNPLSVIL